MWKIKLIFDGEYGCEDNIGLEKNLVSLTLEDEEHLHSLFIMTIMDLEAYS